MEQVEQVEFCACGAYKKIDGAPRLKNEENQTPRSTTSFSDGCYFARLAPISTKYFAQGQDDLVDEVFEVAPNIMSMNAFKKSVICKGSHLTFLQM
jgi:hypothetical protein